MFYIWNIIMNQCNKRRNNDEKAMIQRQFIITLQEMWSFSENSEKKRDERDTKEVSWSDLSENQKHIDDATRFNHVDLQARKRRRCIARSKFRSLNSSEKVSEMSEENCRLNACSALKLRDTDTWCIYHIEHKQSEDDHQKIDER